MHGNLSDKALKVGDTVVCIRVPFDPRWGLYKDQEYVIKSVFYGHVELVGIQESWVMNRFEKVNYSVITEPSEDIYNDLI